MLGQADWGELLVAGLVVAAELGQMESENLLAAGLEMYA